MSSARATVIAYTVFDADQANNTIGCRWTDDPWSSDAEQLAEFAGRNCYQSWENKAGRTNKEYLQDQIIAKNHGSVLEHASVTFYIRGVSRSLLAELTRHRHLSFSVLSQRYVDESGSDIVLPPAVLALADESLNAMYQDVAAFAIEAYEHIVETLTEEGMARKDARSAARAVLPQMTETQIVVTGNHRAWREVLLQRLSPGADQEIRNLSGEILRQLNELAPAIYEDIMKGQGLNAN